MEIIDESVEEILEELKPGQIIKYRGDHLMVTDLTNEFDQLETVYLHNGKVKSFDKDDLIDAINDPDQRVFLVSKSKLVVQKYFK